MNDIKTLAEWLNDPTATKDDRFVPDSCWNGGLTRVAFVNGHGQFAIEPDEDDDYPEAATPILFHEYRRCWRRLPPDLTKITAQNALDRGLVKPVAE